MKDPGMNKFEVRAIFALTDYIKELTDTEVYDAAHRLFEKWRERQQEILYNVLIKR